MVRILLFALFVAFIDLEKRKHKNYIEKQYAGARATLIKDPMEPP